MPNQYANKVVNGETGEVIIDLTGDTLLQASQLANGIKAHARSGEPITGTNTNDMDTSALPTKNNLMRIKEKIKLSKQGHELLDKKEIISICTKVVAGILVTVGIFAVVPMIMLAMDIIGVRMAPEGMELPFTFKKLGLDAMEASNPGVLTTYVFTLATTLLAAIYALLHAIGRATFNIAPMKRIEQIAVGAIFVVSLCVLLPTTKRIFDATEKALAPQEEDRNTYMGTQMDEFSKNYLIKNGWTLVKHEHCNDNYVRKGEYYTGDTEHAYLDAWNPAGQQVYHAEKRMPVEPGTSGAPDACQ